MLKYENGKSVISFGRLHEIANILRVPVAFFFEGAPHGSNTTGELPSYVSEFLTTSEGLALTQALMKVSDAKKRRSVVKLVEKLADASTNCWVSRVGDLKPRPRN